MRARPARGLASLALIAAAGLLGADALRPAAGHTDGGVVRAHVDRGALTITLFTSPTPLRVGDADVSVLVQDRASHAVLLDATVVVHLTPLDTGTAPLDVELGRETATNQLLQAATLRLPAPGRFRLAAMVRRAGEEAEVTAEVEVAPSLPPLLALWPYLALPPVVVGIFLVQQWLRRRSSGTARILRVADPGGAAR
jgi:hypothetical protein